MPAIVVAAYDRPDSLRRLLGTLVVAHYPADGVVPLVISIDKSESRAVVEVAESFKWQYGPYRVIEHPRNLGLREHILSCGDLAYDYGSVILLEDDLMVSPAFYCYTQDALAFYENDPRIAGVSLYTHAQVPYLRVPFIPLVGEGDVFFLQFASSWGQAWSVMQWQHFRNWYKAGRKVSAMDPLPAPVTKWPDSSWLKYFIKYMVESNLFFVYPRFSLATNCGEPGEHFTHRQTIFQVPLIPQGRTFRFQKLDAAIAVYDAYFELLADRLNLLTDRLSDYSYEVDTYGSKDPTKLSADYLLTSRSCRDAVVRFGNDMRPEIINVVHGTPGSKLSLCRRDTPLESMVGARPSFDEFNVRYSTKVVIWFLCLKVLIKLRSLFFSRGEQ